MSEYNVMIMDQGQLTLPNPIRTELNVQEYDVLTVVRVGNSILLTPRRTRVDELTDQISTLFEKEGVTLNDLMKGLEEDRKAIANS